MAYLGDWRIALAADLLRESDRRVQPEHGVQAPARDDTDAAPRHES
jgi:hypothetical protein